MRHPSGFFIWGDEERAAAQRVIDSGQITYATETEALENELCQYLGRRYAVACNSGSSANWLALSALCYRSERPIQIYDGVVTPSVAWGTTWSPILQRNLHPHLADIDETWNCPTYDPLQIGASLIVTCPVLGNPTHVGEWFDTARQQDLLCWEDACESLGAVTDDGRKIGTLGDVSTLSFYASHQVGCGEGGAVVMDDGELWRLCRQLRSHGWTRDTHKIENFEDEYCFEFPGMNLRPVEVTMAVARVALAKLDSSVAERRKNLIHFRTETLHLPIQLPRTSGLESPFGLAFTVESKEIRGRLVTKLRASGIDCRLPTGGSSLKHPMMAPWRAQLTPRADRLHDTGLFLGNAPYPIPHLIERAVKVMKDTL